jgi:hypothetical protein
MSDKWTFFHNGYTWWLRIDNAEQLARYCELTDEERYGGAMMQAAWHRKENKLDHWDGLASEIDMLSRNRQESLLVTAGKLLSDAHYTYFKNLQQFGFVNINRLGGCNSSTWPMRMIIKKDELVFPMLGRKDVTIKTWEWKDKKRYAYRPGYQYHWYAYIGDVRLKDGDKEKWDTRAEAEAFVNSLFVEK